MSKKELKEKVWPPQIDDLWWQYQESPPHAWKGYDPTPNNVWLRQCKALDKN